MAVIKQYGQTESCQNSFPTLLVYLLLLPGVPHRTCNYHCHQPLNTPTPCLSLLHSTATSPDGW